MSQPSRKFRDHIFSSFVLYSILILTGAAAAIFATYKLTEDAVIADVLAGFASQTADEMLYYGRVADMPPEYVSALQGLPPGLTELETTPGEAAVYKRGQGETARYAMLVLPQDSDATSYFIALGVASVFILALALFISWRLAKQFSAPIERMSLQLANDWHLSSSDDEVEELAYLAHRIEQYRRDRDLRLMQATTFSQSISHELRTPITVIQGAVELLEAEELTDRTRAKVARVRRAIESLALTTEVLLYITHRERQLEGSSFTEALNAVVEQQQALLEAQVDIKLSLNEYPLSIYEWAPLVVLLQTLLANSVRFSSQGTIAIEVNETSALVKDQGPGMSEDCLNRVRSNAVRKGRLGYAIVHRICERCDWQLQIDNGPEGLEVAINFSATYETPEPTIPST